jgi:hypothetical protein
VCEPVVKGVNRGVCEKISEQRLGGGTVKKVDCKKSLFPHPPCWGGGKVPATHKPLGGTQLAPYSMCVCVCVCVEVPQENWKNDRLEHHIPQRVQAQADLSHTTHTSGLQEAHITGRRPAPPPTHTQHSALLVTPVCGSCLTRRQTV